MSNGLINRQYVGARYVPKIMGEWNKALQYEALSIVTYMGNSFTSKVPVPANIDIINENYWVNTGNYNEQIEEYRKDVSNLSNKVASLPYVTPTMFGANGTGLTDDTDAILTAIAYANTNRKILVFDKIFLINKELTINSGTNIIIEGTIGNLNTLIASTSTANIIIGENGSINLVGTANVTFRNLGFRGSGKGNGDSGINIKSFRNTFDNCTFDKFNTAISVGKAINWNGENRITNCLFQECTNCVIDNEGSDSYFTNNIIHSLCDNSLKGIFSGYQIIGNHDYSLNGMTLGGYCETITGNYFDGYKKLTITGNTGPVIVGNTFLGEAKDSTEWCIKFTNNIVNHGNISGNIVVDSSNTAKRISGLVFIYTNNVEYFNNVIIDGNDVSQCEKLITATSNYRAYQKNIQPITTTYNNLSAVTPLINTVRMSINGCVGHYHAKATAGSWTYADICELQGAYNNCFNIIRIKTNNTEEIKITTDRKISIPNYSALTEIDVLSIMDLPVSLP
jgi:hypothetical protein